MSDCLWIPSIVFLFGDSNVKWSLRAHKFDKPAHMVERRGMAAKWSVLVWFSGCQRCAIWHIFSASVITYSKSSRFCFLFFRNKSLTIEKMSTTCSQESSQPWRWFQIALVIGCFIVTWMITWLLAWRHCTLFLVSCSWKCHCCFCLLTPVLICFSCFSVEYWKDGVCIKKKWHGLFRRQKWDKCNLDISRYEVRSVWEWRTNESRLLSCSFRAWHMAVYIQFKD